MTPSVSGMVSAYMTRALYKYNNCITFKFSLVEARRPGSIYMGPKSWGPKRAQMTRHESGGKCPITDLL